jgi:hypothetical protein
MQITQRDRAVRLELTLDRVAVPEIGFWAVAVVLGAAQAWKAGPYLSSIDAVSYLDLGDRYARGDWKSAINAYWSPLYSLVQGLWLAILQPAAPFQYQVVKLADFGIFLLALVSFKWLLDGLRAASRAGIDHDGAPPVPDWVWVAVGYTLFLWSSLVWITVVSNTPDMLAAALLYGAWGLLVRFDDRRRIWPYLAFGALLALAYLSRTALAIVGGVAMVGLLALPHYRTHRRGAVLAVAAFLVLAAPLVGALSAARGRLTIGDSGKLNHFWLANPPWYTIPDRHWQGGPPGYGAPKHASRELWDAPATYEFGEPISGTYPPWTDPAYWYEGLKYHFDASAEWQMVRDNAVFYFRLFGAWLLATIAAVLLLAAAVKATGRRLLANAAWWLPPAAGLGAYFFANDLLLQWRAWQEFSSRATPITQPPSRYVATLVVLFALMLLASLRRRTAPAAIERASAVVVAAVAVSLVGVAAAQTHHLVRRPLGPTPWHIAAALQDRGVHAGMRVAILGSGVDHAAWARLAGVRIVAEIPDVHEFWRRSPDVRRLTLQRLRGAQVDMVVASWLSRVAPGEGWTPVADVGYGVMPSALCAWPCGDSRNGNVTSEHVQEAARQVADDAQRHEEHGEGERRSRRHADAGKEPDKCGLTRADAVEGHWQEHHEQNQRHEREERLERRGDAQPDANEVCLDHADDLHADGAEQDVEQCPVMRAVPAQRGEQPFADGGQAPWRTPEEGSGRRRHAFTEDQEQREQAGRAGDRERRQDSDVASETASEDETSDRHHEQRRDAEHAVHEDRRHGIGARDVEP